MGVKILALFLVLMVFMFSPFAPISAEANPIAVRLLNQTVAVLQGGGLCSGTLIRRDRVLTAHHCVEGHDDILVDAAGNQEANATVLLDSQGYDLAVLQLDRAFKAPAVIAEVGGPLEAGDEVWVVGHPLGEFWMVFWGHVSKVSWTKFVGCDKTNKDGGQDHWISSLDSRGYPGNSGGGVYDASGRLSGVFVGAAVDSSCSDQGPWVQHAPALWGLAVDWRTVSEFLAGLPK